MSERLYNLDRDKVGPCSCLDYHLLLGEGGRLTLFPCHCVWQPNTPWRENFSKWDTRLSVTDQFSLTLEPNVNIQGKNWLQLVVY